MEPAVRPSASTAPPATAAAPVAAPGTARSGIPRGVFEFQFALEFLLWLRAADGVVGF